MKQTSANPDNCIDALALVLFVEKCRRYAEEIYTLTTTIHELFRGEMLGRRGMCTTKGD